MIGETIGAAFRPHRRALGRPARPDRPAAGHPLDLGANSPLTSRRSPPGWSRSDCKPGDRIGIWSPNNAEWVVTQFATAKAGLILVNINPAYRLTEVEYALNKVGCKALVTATRVQDQRLHRHDQYAGARTRHACPGDLRAARLPALRSVIQIGGDDAGTFPFDKIAHHGRDGASRSGCKDLAPLLQFDEPINIQFTSGTTGLPKGATLTHHNILNNGFFIGELLHYTEQDKVCIPVPMYHCFGMVIGILACMTHGAAIVFPGEGFDPLATLQTVAEDRCTSLYGVPTMFIAELDHPTSRNSI